MPLNEIITRWTAQSSPGGLTVMYFNADTGTLSTQRAALAAMWSTVDDSLSVGTNWAVDTVGRTIREDDGEAVGFWSETTARVGSGVAAGNPVPNASQVLIRWETAGIVSGRRIRGRSFVPGLAASLTVQGQITGAARATLAAAANTLPALPQGFSVWSRPRKASGTTPARDGDAYLVTTASVWDELAILRDRR